MANVDNPAPEIGTDPSRYLTEEAPLSFPASPLDGQPLWKRVGLWIAPNLTAFIASFCIMVIELVAGRVIARHLGSSLYTWTSVIGVVLAGITIGNLVGGRLADWFRPAAVLSVLFLLACAASVLIMPINEWVASWKGWTTELDKANFFVWTLGKLSGAEAQIPWSARIFGHVFIVFLLPSTILGTIGPVVAKMALDQGRKVGKTVGNVYAWGALGSIAGTFVTGFYLISKVGTGATVIAVALGLGLMGVIYSLTIFWPAAKGGPVALLLAFLSIVWAFAIPAVAFEEYFREHGGKLPYEWVVHDGRTVLREIPTGDEIYVEESDYTYMRVERTTEVTEEGTEPRRDLVMDSLIHAEWVPGQPKDLQYEYEKIYQAITHRFAPPEAGVAPEAGDDGDDAAAGQVAEAGAPARPACLFLGGGGYVFPRYIRAVWPRSYIEVAEIDPAVTAADVEAFGLDPKGIQVVEKAADLKRADNPFWIYHMDARNHVDDMLRRKADGEPVPEFDFIYGDAFNFLGVPFHLTTAEFNVKVKQLLKPDTGIYMVNVIDIFESGQFIGAVYNTFKETFGENVYVFCTTKDEPDMRETGRDTFIVIGSMRPLEVEDLPGAATPYEFTGSLLKRKHLDQLEEKSNRVVLKDDYAPVENLLEYVVNRWKS